MHETNRSRTEESRLEARAAKKAAATASATPATPVVTVEQWMIEVGTAGELVVMNHNLDDGTSLIHGTWIHSGVCKNFEVDLATGIGWWKDEGARIDNALSLTRTGDVFAGTLNWKTTTAKVVIHKKTL